MFSSWYCGGVCIYIEEGWTSCNEGYLAIYYESFSTCTIYFVWLLRVGVGLEVCGLL